MTPSQDDHSGGGSENESVVEEEEAALWPASTNLIRSKSSKNLSLKAQQHQVKLAIRQTMDYLEEKILFDNAYPSLHLRNAWNHDGMMRACDKIGNYLPRSVQRMYDAIASRIQGDAYCLKAVSSLVCIPPLMLYNMQVIFFRFMRASASFAEKQKWPQLTILRVLQSSPIRVSIFGRSTTFFTGSSTYIQPWFI
jgi:hypothetical protein